MVNIKTCRLYILLFVLVSLPAFSRQRYYGWCQQGAATFAVSGMGGYQITPKGVGVYPSCTVTVYLSGTITPATIYADNNGTAKSNSFAADATGYWYFYADTGRYDVAQIANGWAGRTLGDLSGNDISGTYPANYVIASPAGASGPVAPRLLTGVDITGTLNATGVTGNFNVPGLLTALSTNTVLSANQYPGSDIGAKVNAAIAACPSNGCEVDISSGSYSVSTVIVMNVPNVRLHGVGAGSTVLTLTYVGDLISVIANNCTIDGFTLSGGTQTGFNPILIHAVKSNYGSVYDNILTTSGLSPAFNQVMGVRIEGTNTATANYWNVHDNYFVSIPYIGFSVASNGNHNQARGNWFMNGGEAFDFNGVGQPITDNVFANNHVVGGFGASFLESAVGSFVTGNSFDYSSSSTSYSLINVHLAAGGSQKRSVISGNVFRGNAGTADCLNIYDNSDETLVDGNIFDSCGHSGISLSTGAGADINLAITNNIFHNNGVANAAGGYNAISGTLLNTHALAQLTIANNIAYDDQGTPSQTYGFGVSGSGTIFNSYIHDNDFSRNKTGAFSFTNGASLHSSTAVGPNRETTNGSVVFETLVTGVGLQANHIGGTGNTPTGACGPVAGTCTGVAVSGNDFAGSITFTTGTTAPSSGASIFTLTFASQFNSNPHCSVTPSSAFAASDFSSLYVFPPGVGSLTIASTAGPFTSSTQHTYQYVCAGY